ncbi:MAG: hypothetical protein FJZ57_03630, partial [Chlamydiae bacterium]|nr:hypothetical protein [Chlamydiota bacterium]
MSSGPDEVSKSRYFKIEYQETKDKTSVLRTRTIKVKGTDSQLTSENVKKIFEDNTELLKHLAAPSKKISEWSVSHEGKLSPETTESKVSSIAGGKIAIVKAKELAILPSDLNQNIKNLTSVKEPTWTSWFLSFFPKWAKNKEESEIYDLFNIDNTYESFTETLKTLEDCCPDDDNLLKPKIKDALENSYRIKEAFSNKKFATVLPFLIRDIISDLTNGEENEIIIPIQNSINGQPIPSFLIIKSEKIKSREGTEFYQYSITKVGNVKEGSDDLDKVQVIRSFICNERMFHTLLQMSFQNQKEIQSIEKPTETTSKTTKIDEIIDDLIKNNSTEIRESPISSKNAFSKPKTDPLNLCLLLGKLSTDEMPSKLRTDIKSLEKSRRKIDSYLESASFIKDLDRACKIPPVTAQPIVTASEQKSELESPQKSEASESWGWGLIKSLGTRIASIWSTKSEDRNTDSSQSTASMQESQTVQSYKKEISEYLNKSSSDLKENTARPVDHQLQNLFDEIMKAKKTIEDFEKLKEASVEYIKSKLGNISQPTKDEIRTLLEIEEGVEITSIIDSLQDTQKINEIHQKVLNDQIRTIEDELSKIEQRSKGLNKPDLLFKFVSKLAEKFIRISTKLSDKELDKMALNFDSKLLSLESKLTKAYGKEIAQEFVFSIREKVTNRINGAKKRLLEQQNNEIINNLGAKEVSSLPKLRIMLPTTSTSETTTSKETPSQKTTKKLPSEFLTALSQIKKIFNNPVISEETQKKIDGLKNALHEAKFSNSDEQIIDNLEKALDSVIKDSEALFFTSFKDLTLIPMYLPQKEDDVKKRLKELHDNKKGEFTSSIAQLEELVKNADNLIKSENFSFARMQLDAILASFPDNSSSELLQSMPFEQIQKLVKISIEAQEKLLETRLRIKDPLPTITEYNSLKNVVCLTDYLAYRLNCGLEKSNNSDTLTPALNSIQTIELLIEYDQPYDVLASQLVLNLLKYPSKNEFLNDYLVHENNNIFTKIQPFQDYNGLCTVNRLAENITVTGTGSSLDNTNEPLSEKFQLLYFIHKFYESDNFKALVKKTSKEPPEQISTTEIQDVIKAIGLGKKDRKPIFLHEILPEIDVECALNFQRKQDFLQDALLNMEQTFFTESPANNSETSSTITTAKELRSKRNKLFEATAQITGRLKIGSSKLDNGNSYLVLESEEKKPLLFYSGFSDLSTGYTGLKQVIGTDNIPFIFDIRKVEESDKLRWVIQEPISDLQNKDIDLQLLRLDPGSPLSVESAITFIRDNKAFLDNPIVIEKLRTIFENSHLLKLSFVDCKTFWTDFKVEELKSIFNECIQKKNLTGALLLVSISNSLKSVDESKSPNLRLDDVITIDNSSQSLLAHTLDILGKAQDQP